MTTNIFAMADTWNASGTVFTAIQMNVTNTASAAGSMLLNLQVGGTNNFQVDPAGNLYVGNPVGGFSNTGIMALGAVFGTGGGNPSFIAGEQLAAYASTTKVLEMVFGSHIKQNSAASIEWSSTSSIGATDLAISRKAANVLSVDTSTVGNSLGGIAPQSKAGAFVATDFPAGSWYVGRDTTNLTTKLYYNNAGTLMAVALA